MSIAVPGDDKRCDWCDRPGVPYEYKGQTFSGLTPFKGDKLCPTCRDARMDQEGVDILVVDDRPTIPPYVHNTVRDRDKISIALPPDLRGVDGRDRIPRRRAQPVNHAEARRQAAQAEQEQAEREAQELLDKIDR